jgi:hypothetical protein
LPLSHKKLARLRRKERSLLLRGACHWTLNPVQEQTGWPQPTRIGYRLGEIVVRIERDKSGEPVANKVKKPSRWISELISLAIGISGMDYACMMLELSILAISLVE